MQAMRFAHKGLQRLSEEDGARGLPQHLAPRIRGILAELEAADIELIDYH